MKVFESHAMAQRFKNIFGVNMGDFVDKEYMLLDNGNVHIDPLKIEKGLLLGKEGYDPDMSIKEGLVKLYGQHAADLIESLL